MIDTGTQGIYQYGRGDGVATIQNGYSLNTSARNELDFEAGISNQNLWFLRSGSSQLIDVMGTSSQITVAGWFASTGNQLQEITAGGLKLDTQLSQLVSAMATYLANNPGFNATLVSQGPNDATLQNVIGASWHS